MPRIIDYARVLPAMTACGLACNYFNSGSFGFAAGQVRHRGWIGPADSSIRPEFAAMASRVPQPYAENLAIAAMKFWQQADATPLWVMPKSHWHFELHDGSRDWLPEVLAEIGVEAKDLQDRADGSALEFSPAEAAPARLLLANLLDHLTVSDFSLGFAGQPVIAAVHHLKQIWWSTTDPALARRLDGISRGFGQ